MRAQQEGLQKHTGLVDEMDIKRMLTGTKINEQKREDNAKEIRKEFLLEIGATAVHEMATEFGKKLPT